MQPDTLHPRSCPNCRSIGTPRDGCQNLWHIEVRPVVSAPLISASPAKIPQSQPDTLHEQLRAEIDRRLAVARAADNGDSKLTSWINWPGGEGRRQIGLCFNLQDEPAAIIYLSRSRAEALLAVIEAGDPADAVRRYEGELEVLERHAPCACDLAVDRPHCRTHRCRANEGHRCAEILSLARRLGVNVDG